jgi:secondary thiamine-phosphate synthase enzyme
VKQHQQTVTIRTPGRGLHDVTSTVAAVVSAAGVLTGLCVVYCQHTSCSLLVQENASPDARADLLGWLARLCPDGDPQHSHADEGPDDMPAHLRAAITRTSETIPVVDGRLGLGRWQGLYLAEHRLAGSPRRLLVHVTGL